MVAYNARIVGEALAAPSESRPELARWVLILQLFSAASAIGGGTALIWWRAGDGYFPLTLIEHTPFKSLLVPGLLLAIVVGGSCLVSALLSWRRMPAAVYATILAGGALTVWIIAEVAIMRGIHWLHACYGSLGMMLLVLGIDAAWRARLPYRRWLLFVTVAEAVGFLVPVSAGILSTKAGSSELWQAVLVVVCGFAEGALLGLGQAWAFPFPVRRFRYALLSALGAGLVWASAMSMTLLMSNRAVPVAVVAVAIAATALFGLTAIGAGQWLELRRHTRMAHRWILWTALAWILALPLSFAPTPFVDEATPLASSFVLWGCAGLLMAHVMALVTWQGVRRLQR